MIESLTTIANRHDFSTTFTAEYDNDQTAATIITPTSGKKIKVTGVRLSTEGGASGGEKVRIYFATSANTIATIYITNAVQNTVLEDIVVTGAVDEVVKLTTNLGAGKNYFLSVNYREE